MPAFIFLNIKFLKSFSLRAKNVHTWRLFEYNSSCCLREGKLLCVYFCIIKKYHDKRDKNEFKMWKNTSKNAQSTISKILIPCNFFVLFGWDLFVHESSKSFIENWLSLSCNISIFKHSDNNRGNYLRYGITLCEKYKKMEKVVDKIFKFFL